jgi:PAS domain S-box-containing protein
MVRASDRSLLFENPAMYKMMQDTPDSAPKLAGMSDINPAERAAYEQQLRETGAADDCEIHFRHPDGARTTAAMSGRLINFRGESVIVSAYVDVSERKAREEELKLARETLEDAIEALEDGFVLYDANDRLVMVNGTYKSFHGDMADLLVPGAYWPYVTRKRGEAGLFSEATEGLEEWLQGQMAQRGIAKREEFPAAGGKWFEYTHMPTRQGGFVSVWRDVTQRKQMEQSLRESEALVRRVLEACPLPIRMWNPETGQVIYESPASREVFGHDAFSTKPHDISKVYVDPADRDNYLVRLRESGTVDNIEMQLRRADRSVFWASVSARLIEFGDGQAVVSTIVDLSDRKAMEQTLRDREEQFRSMVEGHPLPVWMVDLETSEILYESPSAAELVGRSGSASGPAYSIDHFADRDECVSLNDRLRHGSSMKEVEVRFKKTDGTEFWAAMNDRLVTYGEREVSITSFTDLTSRREAEAELARQREMMHQSEKLSALGELLAGVSHELNNPLSVLVGQAMMLRDTAPDEKTAQRAERIEKAADRCARIVKTFLSMARHETRQYVPINVNDTIESALEVTGYSLRTAGIEVTRKLAGELPVVLADGDQLVQVFTNLILNAEQAMHDVDTERRLRVISSYRKTSDQVVVKFKDSGPGIPEEIRSRIFEPLYTTKETGSGTGLGLALCHRIVEAHGGTIELEPDTGKGAAFAIRFNCERNRDLEAPAVIENGADQDQLRVLVVDDEVEVAQIFTDILELDGHKVEMVSSAHAALQKIERRDYDVILSDVRMPGMDGPAFFAALREAKPEQIAGLGFMTGDTLSKRVSDFLSSAGRPYLEKPITPNDIRDLIARLMRAKAEGRNVGKE